MNDPKLFSNPCAICKIREATQLCDFIIEYNLNPIFVCVLSNPGIGYKYTKEANESKYDTCDLPLCKECSHEINNADFCPHHYKLQQQVELPEHLRKWQMKSKARLHNY